MSRPISTYFSKSSTLDISGGSSAVEGSAEDANAQDTAIKRTLMKGRCLNDESEGVQHFLMMLLAL